MERFRISVDARRHARDRAERDETRTLFASRTLDGMVAVKGMLTPLVGEALLLALDAVSAPAGPEDTRSAAQRRHDGLYDLLRAATDAATLPETGGSRPQIVVHVPAATFTAALKHGRGSFAADATAASAPLVGLEPGWFEHTGAVVDLLTLAALAEDAAISWLLLRGERVVLDHGRAVRTATPAQRRALAARDRGCVICGRPPRRCDAHHLLAWEDGGPTDLCNLVLIYAATTTTCSTAAGPCTAPTTPAGPCTTPPAPRSAHRRCTHDAEPPSPAWPSFRSESCSSRLGRVPWGFSSVGRASRWQREGQEFESPKLHNPGSASVEPIPRPRARRATSFIAGGGCGVLPRQVDQHWTTRTTRAGSTGPAPTVASLRA